MCSKSRRLVVNDELTKVMVSVRGGTLLSSYVYQLMHISYSIVHCSYLSESEEQN